MKTSIIGLFVMFLGMQVSLAQNTVTVKNNNTEQEIIELSKLKWQWMADKNVDTLEQLFDEKSMFVHMGGSWGKEREINVIKSGGIWYKKADVYSVSVSILDKILIFSIFICEKNGGIL